jgi:hypothetical protein
MEVEMPEKKSIGTEVAEALMAHFVKIGKIPAPPKPKPKLEVVAESEVVPESVTVGAVRSVGEVLEKLDPEGAKGARFVRATMIREAQAKDGRMSEELYWAAVRREFDAPLGVVVRFEYDPLVGFDDDVPSPYRSR